VARPQQFGEEKKRRFIENLEEVGSIKAAASAVRVGTGSVDWARRSDGQFAAEVERVLESWRSRPPAPMARGDGFTAKKRRRCIKTLAKTGCTSDAARVAGVSRKTINDWRAKDPDFDRLCRVAISKAAGHIETLAWERAVTGIEEPIVHYGKQVGTRIKRSDSIFRMLLIASNREKYGRMGVVDRKAAEREMRARIEAEIRAEEVPIEQVRERILARLDAISRHQDRQEGGEG
jgi:hypothetical protein